MAILQYSCCGCSLKNGSKAIAIFSILLQSLFLIALCVFLYAMHILYGVKCENRKMDKYFSSKEQCNISKELMRHTFRPAVIFGLVLLSLLLLMDSLFLFGVVHNRRSFMIPWIIVEIIGIVTGFAGITVVIVKGKGIGFDHLIICCTILLGLVCAVSVYFLLVVIAYYQQLGEIEVYMRQTPGLYPVPYSPVLRESSGYRYDERVSAQYYY